MSGNASGDQLQSNYGGLQPLQMLQALRGGASMQQIHGMNPTTPRPMQFLPPAMPTFDYMGQFRQQQADAARAAQQQQAGLFRAPFQYGTDGGDAAGGVDGSGAVGIGSGIGIDASAADAVNGHDSASNSGVGGDGGGAK